MPAEGKSPRLAVAHGEYHVAPQKACTDLVGGILWVGTSMPSAHQVAPMAHVKAMHMGTRPVGLLR